MTRRLVVEWRPGRRVEALLQVPPEASGTGIVLAHGAGAGQRHPFMVGLRKRLAGRGFPTMTFDYPYVAAGRRAPDRASILLECHRAAVQRLRRYADRVVLAGKSMGGRMASHLAARGESIVGLACYGYPLIPVGKRSPRPVEHLRSISVPMLFVSGSRDRMAPSPMLEDLVAGLPAARLERVAEADHSFSVGVRSGRRLEDVLDEVAEITARWLGRRTALR